MSRAVGLWRHAMYNFNVNYQGRNKKFITGGGDTGGTVKLIYKYIYSNRKIIINFIPFLTILLIVNFQMYTN